MKICFLFTLIFASVFYSMAQKNSYDQKFAPKNGNNAVTFTENKGQVTDQNFKSRTDVLFTGNVGGMIYHLRNSGISYQLRQVNQWKEEIDTKAREKKKAPKQTTIYRLDINWLNINSDFETKTGEALSAYNNYYGNGYSNGILNVKKYTEITYLNLYKNIDLHYYEKKGVLKYDYIIAPHSNYKQIKLQVKGALEIKLQLDGSVIYKTPLGDIIEGAPLVYQQGNQLKAKWIIEKNILSFEIENFDDKLQLIIDPAVRHWGTYLGGTSQDIGTTCSVDSIGNVFFGGYTYGSTNLATTGSHQTNYVFAEEPFLAKYNSGGALLWSTYYGNGGNDRINASTTDGSQNVYIIGYTSSTIGIATLGSHQPSNSAGFDAFVAKFNSNGVRQWATYYGGNSDDYGNGCTTDNLGNLYLTGYTNTSSFSVISTPFSHQGGFGGGIYDGFLVKFNSSGVRQWATFYGGGGDDYGNACCTDGNGNVFMTGRTESSGSIVTSGAQQTSMFGGSSFLVKFNSNGVRQWGTYYGTSQNEIGFCCVADKTGNVYMTGSTSTSGTLITTLGSHQDIFPGNISAYLAKFNSNGVRQWATYYSCGGGSWGYGCVTDTSKNVYMTGQTSCATGTFISTAGNHQVTFGGAIDAYLVKFDSTGVRKWGTYYGGVGWDQSNSCTVDKVNNIFIAGYSESNSGIATSASPQTTVSGNLDGFVAKFFDCTGSIPIAINATGLPQSTICSNNSATLTVLASGGTNWYSSATSTTVLYSGSSFITPTSIVGTYTFYAEYGTICNYSVYPRIPVVYSVMPSPNVLVNSGTTCAGQVFTIQPTGATSYSVTGGNFVVSPIITTTYSVAGSYTNGCISPASVSTVNVLSIPTLTIIGTATTCAGTSHTISVLGSVSSFTWNGIVVSNSIVTTPSTTIVLTVACTGTNACLATTNKTITVYQKPNLIWGGALQICYGDTELIVLGGAINYTWNGLPSANTVVINPLVTTNYAITGTDIHGCVNTNNFLVSVNQLPNILISTSNSVSCYGETTTLSAFGAINYTWSSGDLSDFIIVSPNIPTDYTVIGTDINGCANTTTITLNAEDCVGLNNQIKNHDIFMKLFPNPNNGLFIIDANFEQEVSIINPIGQIVFQKTIIRGRNRIDLSLYASGIYFIQLKQQGVTSAIKLLKE